jgi:hypothetical protein
MRLTFGQVEDLLASLHAVSDEHRIALRGRIKHFQRNGWPRGTNTGKGRPARYDFPSLLALAVAFELTQVGMTPDRIVEVLAENWSIVSTAANLVLARPDRDEPASFIYLYCDPSTLSTLSKPSQHHRDEMTFRFLFGFQLVQGFQQSEPIPRRLALVNLTDLLNSMWKVLQDIPGVAAMDREAAYNAWAIAVD